MLHRLLQIRRFSVADRDMEKKKSGEYYPANDSFDTASMSPRM
jgi:hypothetical protein